MGLPVTGFARQTKDVEGLIKLVGGAPLIIKLLERTQGVGVVLAETAKAAESVITAFQQLDANILVQEFIKEAGAADIRAFIVNGKVVASMMRQGPDGEFRSNIHRGGTAKKIKLTPQERRTATRSAKLLGLGGRQWRTEISLTSRATMGFEMLLGRRSMRGKAMVDPKRSFVLGEPKR